MSQEITLRITLQDPDERYVPVLVDDLAHTLRLHSTQQVMVEWLPDSHEKRRFGSFGVNGKSL